MLYYSFLSAKNEISDSFIFLTNCFLLRREKLLDRFSIQPPKNSRISSWHANFLHASSSRRGGGGRKRRREGPREEAVNTFPFGAVGEGGRGRFIRRNSGRNLMQINAGRRGCGAAGKWGREMLSIVLRRYT